jgi:hypothetical protein
LELGFQRGLHALGFDYPRREKDQPDEQGDAAGDDRGEALGQQPKHAQGEA